MLLPDTLGWVALELRRLRRSCALGSLPLVTGHGPGWRPVTDLCLFVTSRQYAKIGGQAWAKCDQVTMTTDWSTVMPIQKSLHIDEWAL
jgi:hypothetical protein